MIVQARAVVTMDGPPIENGAVVVEGNRIVAVGPASELRRVAGEEPLDLGAMALLPGLINAHCHLDYSTLRNAISPPKSFTAWVRRINAIKRSLSSEDYLEAIRRGFHELQMFGTTAVCNLEAFPELMHHLTDPPIRTWWCYEMIDIRHRVTTDEVVRGALAFFKNSAGTLSHYGLCPHAPYTASRSLYGLANSCAETMPMLLTTHLAESREERQMFLESSGPLFDFLRSIGRPMDDCRGATPFAQLWREGALHCDWMLVHMNELEEGDFDLLSSLPAGEHPHVVHCPGSHAYFAHTPFPYRRLSDLGVNISLGTDSLASTKSLSLFEEMRRLRENEPWLDSEEIVATVTRNPARALQQAGKLGCIAPGALADLIALPLEPQNGVASLYDRIIEYAKPVSWMMIDGKIRSV